ncbi:MAG: hypothetical protein CMJ42_08940 [Phyllobacteriaceae bacterium]|nr:hypothetical protein [Phyllobacteriaceae bacterium]
MFGGGYLKFRDTKVRRLVQCPKDTFGDFIGAQAMHTAIDFHSIIAITFTILIQIENIRILYFSRIRLKRYCL